MRLTLMWSVPAVAILAIGGLSWHPKLPFLAADRVLAAEGVSEVVYPQLEWQHASPEACGLNAAAISEMGRLMAQNRANGVLVSRGYLVAEWTYGGARTTRFGTQSVTKSITALVLGLALDDGLIPDIDAKILDHWPDFRSANGHAPEITFRHLATHTGGLETSGRWHYSEPTVAGRVPGTEFNYHNNNYAALASALTYLYGRPLEQVLRERALVPLQADMSWDQDGSIQTAAGRQVAVNAGYAFSRWTARDLARVGHLYLHRGLWREETILSEAYIGETFTQITYPIGESYPDGYGLGWWKVGEAGAWAMRGNGGQFCMVVPEHGIVMTKVNAYSIPREEQLSSDVFYPLIMEMLAASNATGVRPATWARVKRGRPAPATVPDP